MYSSLLISFIFAWYVFPALSHFSIIITLCRMNLDKDSSWNVRMFQCLTIENNFNRVNYIILIICLILTYSMKTEWHSYHNIGHVNPLNFCNSMELTHCSNLLRTRIFIRSNLGQAQVKHYSDLSTYLSHSLYNEICLLVHHCSIIGFEFLNSKIYVSEIVSWFRNPD